MKLTTEQISHLKSKPYFQEGFIGKLFARKLGKLLKKDTDFMKAVDKLDNASEKLKKTILDAEKKGVKIPKELKQYAGL